MRSEIERLRTLQRESERVIGELLVKAQSTHSLNGVPSREKHGAILEVLHQSQASTSELANNVTTYLPSSDRQAIQSALRPAQSISSMPLTGFDISDAYGAWAGLYEGSSLDGIIRSARTPGQELFLGNEFGLEGQQRDRPKTDHSEFWTTVTSNRTYIEHLLALYFCWEYPIFASLDKKHFLQDFMNQEANYCSSLLVNALLAVGCKFSTEINAQAGLHGIHTAGNQFFVEAKRLLKQEDDYHVLTTIQALGLMSIREASCGSTNESLYYSGQSIRLAIEMGLHIEKDGNGSEAAEADKTVRAATFWGAFSLDQ